MAMLETNTLFDEILDFLASTPTPEQIVAFKPSPVLQGRLSDLLSRNQNGDLTTEELDEFSRMNHFMSMLKIRARKKLAA